VILTWIGHQAKPGSTGILAHLDTNRVGRVKLDYLAEVED
jgi:hypothetical protein